MKKSHCFGSFTRRSLAGLLAGILVAATPAFAQNGAAAPAALSGAESTLAAAVSAKTIRQVTADLSAPAMQGRGTGQPGGEKAAKYIADHFAKLGLKPLGDNGTYLQGIKFKATAFNTAETAFKAGDTTLTLGVDYAVAPVSGEPNLDGAGDLVCIGFGVVSPELKRDDLAGLDLKGKIAVVLNGKPKDIDEAKWKKLSNPQARIVGLVGRGVTGIILAGFKSGDTPFAQIADYLSRRQVSLGDRPTPPFKLPPVLLVGDEGMEKLFAGTGSTYAEQLKKAEAGEFASRDLKKAATIAVRTTSEEVTGYNVVGLLEGSDAALKDQAVVQTAHYDAYGVTPAGKIYPGAADNALGTGMLVGIAEAMAKAKDRPRRATIFLAVTGEEYGLLGAKYWTEHPTWPIDKVIADVNYDGIGTEVYGPIKNVVGFGAEHSDMGKTFDAVLAAFKLRAAADPLPEENVFYRSDHYNFVQKGIPALMLLGGPDVPMDQFITRMKKWMATDYHQPTDTIRPDWNWEGPRVMAAVGLVIGMRTANADGVPAWLPTSPFNPKAEKKK